MSNFAASQIFIGNSQWQQVSPFLQSADYDKTFVLTDYNTQEYCLPTLQKQIPALNSSAVISIPPGEENKSLKTCQKIWNQLIEKNATRESLLINLGGGIITDIGGFTASTFKRGINFMNMPTTLLGQVDAAIGGKTGVNYHHLKNQIGNFATPLAVFCFPTFFDSLTERQLLNGLAEMIKHALIGEPQLWKNLKPISSKNDLHKINWEPFISSAVEVKKNIVEQDPYEKGARQQLNFGHTFGHILETHGLEQEESLLHGEAIAIGMILELYLSVQKGYLSQKKGDKIQQFILQLYEFPSLSITTDQALKILRHDKKRHRNKIYCTLLKDIGQPLIKQSLTKQDIKNAINYYQSHIV